MNQSFNLPQFFEKEFEHIQKITEPLMKKTSKLLFFSMLLIGFSIVNLIPLVLYVSWSSEAFIGMGLFALMGAIGMALYKEARFYQEKIQKQSIEYMVQRIQKSTTLVEGRRSRYIKEIKDQPKMGMRIFLNFLAEEETRGNM